MNLDESSILSDRDERLLQYLALVTTVLKEQVQPKDENPKRSWWRSFLEPTVLTALVTVLIGGIAGTVITGMIQSGENEREFQQAWLKARGDQSLLAYKEYLDQEQETVKATYSLIGRCISASEDLVELTGPKFARGSHIDVDKDRGKIRDNYNDCQDQWRKDNLRLGLLMRYYHPHQIEVFNSWQSVQISVSTYMGWTSDWYIAREKNKKPTDTKFIEDSSKEEKKNIHLDDQLNKLTQSLENARRYAWEGWESPETLRFLLTKSASPLKLEEDQARSEGTQNNAK